MVCLGEKSVENVLFAKSTTRSGQPCFSLLTVKRLHQRYLLIYGKTAVTFAQNSNYRRLGNWDILLLFLVGLFIGIFPVAGCSSSFAANCYAKMSSSKWTQGNSWLQKTFSLPKKGRGVHLVTEEIKRQIPELGDLKVGLAHIHILHTSGAESRRFCFVYLRLSFETKPYSRVRLEFPNRGML